MLRSHKSITQTLTQFRGGKSTDEPRAVLEFAFNSIVRLKISFSRLAELHHLTGSIPSMATSLIRFARKAFQRASLVLNSTSWKFAVDEFCNMLKRQMTFRIGNRRPELFLEATLVNYVNKFITSVLP